MVNIYSVYRIMTNDCHAIAREALINLIMKNWKYDQI